MENCFPSDTVPVYRVDERLAKHRGPFVYGKENLTRLALLLECADPSDMASAQDDIAGFVMGHHVCGFLCEDDIYRIFDTTMRQWLHEEDYVLSVYDVPKDKVLLGREQCAFPLDDFPRKMFSLVSIFEERI